MPQEELKFSEYKDQITNVIDPIVKEFLDNKVYDLNNAQSWTSTLSDEIIKALRENQPRDRKPRDEQTEFKYICSPIGSVAQLDRATDF